MTHAITLGSDYDLPSLFRLAGALLQAPGIIPQHFKKEGEIVAVIMTGRELGIPPMTALRGINIVKGKVVVDAALQLGLMVRHGAAFEWLKDGTEGEAWLKLKRGGQEPFISKFTLEDAKRAGLAGGDNWRKYPAAMLRARAVSAGGKAYMPDVMAGLYVPGELDDDGEHPRHERESRPDIHVEQPRALAAEGTSTPRGIALPEETESGRIVRELYAVKDAADLARLREEANVARKRMAPDEKEAIRKGIEWATKHMQSLEQQQNDDMVTQSMGYSDSVEVATGDGPFDGSMRAQPGESSPSTSPASPTSITETSPDEPGAHDEPDEADARNAAPAAADTAAGAP